jgi:hypothetical protein
MYPTNYIEWQRRDTEAPTRVLCQWWCNKAADAVRLLPPEKCLGGGEWRDVPTTQQPKEPHRG